MLLVGCSHPGINNIVSEAAQINPHILLVADGFHLVAADDGVIAKVVAALHDTYKVDDIAPGHCTGEPAFVALRDTFRDRYQYAGLGVEFMLTAMSPAKMDPGSQIGFEDEDVAGSVAKFTCEQTGAPFSSLFILLVSKTVRQA